MEKTPQLTNTDYKTILRTYLKTTDFAVKNTETTSLSNKIEGFLGEHYKLTIDYTEQKSDVKKTLRCFMKVLNGSMKTIFEMTKSLRAYEKEEFFYNFLLKEFDNYHINTTFAPKGYLCKPYVVVLEDMSIHGFKSIPKNSFLDVDHCKVAIKALARFHSTSILYEHAKSDGLAVPYNLARVYPKMFQEMIYSATYHSVAKDWFKYSLEGILKVIEFIPDAKSPVKNEEFAVKLREFAKSCDNLYERLAKYKGTILHGDLWNNNLLYIYHENKPVFCVLLDFQILKYGPPSVDVLHLLFANTRKDFRDANFDELVQYYYKSLSECVQNLELDKILPQKEYLTLCDELQAAVKLQCICDRCITFVPDEFVQETVSSDEDLRRYLFEDRAKAIMACFRTCANFREIIMEDLLELRDMLFKQS